MSDLIERQAAIDVLEERLQANGYSNVALVSEFNRSIGYLMRLPSAQPERKTGKWELVSADRYIYRCDVCKKNTFGMSDYCPNCGARMEGEG